MVLRQRNAHADVSTFMVLRQGFSERTNHSRCFSERTNHSRCLWMRRLDGRLRFLGGGRQALEVDARRVRKPLGLRERGPITSPLEHLWTEISADRTDRRTDDRHWTPIRREQ